MRARLWLLPLLALASFPVAAQSRVECDAINSRILGEPVHYCVLLPAGYDANPAGSKAGPSRSKSSPASPNTYPVLYYLHGLGENEQTLFQTGGWNLVDELRRQHKIGDFLIVTPEAKASFYVNSADGKVRYSDFFLREFVPHIESKYRVRRERRARAVSGLSMGGYGALRFAFAYPELFSAVSAQSAALMTMVRPVGPVFGNPINEAHWKQNSPFSLAQKHRTAISRLAIYFNCGREDGFQFYVGAEALDRQLEAEGIKHEFHLYPGDHSAAYFLAHLAEVVTFHSKQFEAGK